MKQTENVAGEKSGTWLRGVHLKRETLGKTTQKRRLTQTQEKQKMSLVRRQT